MGTITAYLCGSVFPVRHSSSRVDYHRPACLRRQNAFVGSSHAVRSAWFGTPAFAPVGQVQNKGSSRWNAMLGGGGILGVGPSEMIVVFAVGWLVLGPQKLFALSRDVGRVVGDIRKSADEASSTFREAMEMEALEQEMAEAEGSLASIRDDEEEEEAPGGVEKGDETGDRQIGNDDITPISREGENIEEDVSDAFRSISESVAVASPSEEARGGEVEADIPNRTARTPPFLPDLEMPGPSSEKDTSGDADVTRSRFLEQLNRVDDPNQSAKVDSFDDSAVEEEVEVARLEYELAKARLAAKQKREREASEDGNKAGA